MADVGQKINAANSWNFALIDYFADMSLLRNDADKSINFQKASCTLDGCVKIWTSRVDSVGTATGQLMSNLANDGRALLAYTRESMVLTHPQGTMTLQRERKARKAKAAPLKVERSARPTVQRPR